jgi:hypothetical protein
LIEILIPEESMPSDPQVERRIATLQGAIERHKAEVTQMLEADTFDRDRYRVLTSSIRHNAELIVDLRRESKRTRRRPTRHNEV